MAEIWKEIKDYPTYEVSNLGRVRSWKGKGQYGKKLETPRIRKLHKNKEGYWFLTLHRNGERHIFRIHRLVIEAFRGKPKKGQQTRHFDGDKDNNKLYNLIYGTCSQNHMDKVRHGVSNRGERHGRNSKLTKGDVIKMRHLYNTGNYMQIYLADMFGVTQGAVGRIVRKETWKWLD